MPVKAGYLLLAGGGAVFIWSGLRGKSVTGVFRTLVGGDNPAKAPNAAPITGITTSSAGTTGTTTTQSGGGIFQTIANSAGEVAFINAVLLGIGAPPTPANISSMTDWISHECTFPPDGINDGGKYNPLNTTQVESGSTTYNSVGVQNYTSATQGVKATIQTLLNGRYPDIVSQLRKGVGLKSGASNGLLTWSGGGYSSV